MIKAIFFDNSDTLYHNPDFEKAQSRRIVEQLAEDRKISYDEAKTLFDETKTRLKLKMTHVPKVVVMMKLGINRMEMHEYLAQMDPRDFLQPDKRLAEILTRLKGKYELGIITNIIEGFLDKVLDSLGIDKEIFKYIVSVDNTEKSKPDQEPFLKALELSGVEAGECVYVGDGLTKDMVPAKQAGMKTIWVSTQEGNGNVDVHIDSIYDIEEAVSRLDS